MDNYKYILEEMKSDIGAYDGYKQIWAQNEFINLVIKVTGVDCFGDAVDYLIDKKGFNL